MSVTYTTNSIPLTGSIPVSNSITYATTTTGTNTVFIDPSWNIDPDTVTVKSTTVSAQSKTKNNQPTEKPFEVSFEDFEDVIEHVPNKVYEFIFYDQKHIKTVCQEEDEFDFDYAFYLAAAKHIWSKELTFEGVLEKANELRTCKKWIKRVKIAKRKFFEKQKEEDKRKEEERLKKERHKKYIAKKKRRNERNAQKANEGLKQVIMEAIRESKRG